MNLQFIEDLRAVVGLGGVIVEHDQLKTYECDGLTNFRQIPLAVVLPRSTAEVQGVVRVCARERIPFVARGAGTGLSGGALPAAGGIVISLARMNRILEVDIENQRIVVEPGVINLHVTERVAPHNLYYAPDPSSQQVCTIGGNVAENAGGAHCLKYGFTVNHVLGLEVVLPDGELVHLGSATLDAPGYDLRGIFIGAEGTLGIATKVTLRVIRRAELVQTLLAAFHTTDDAAAAVSDIIAAGILPAAIEMMDQLSIEAAEAAVHAGYPLEAGGLLLVELDGPRAEVVEQLAIVRTICERHRSWELRTAQSNEERALMWKGRKAAFAAMGRISPDYIVQDGVIPRTKLPQVLREIDAMGAAYGLRVANVFHAGDGNLHPLVLFDSAIEGQEHEAEELSGEILKLCVRSGGSITGEHGVGAEKRKYMSVMFSEPDMDTMQRVRCAFDPHHLANPDKLFPTPRLCGEKPGVYHEHPLVTAGLADLF